MIHSPFFTSGKALFWFSSYLTNSLFYISFFGSYWSAKSLSVGPCPGTLVPHILSLAISASPMALNTVNTDDPQKFISRTDFFHEPQTCVSSFPLVWHLKLNMSKTVLLISPHLQLQCFPLQYKVAQAQHLKVNFDSFHSFTSHLKSLIKSYFLYLQNIFQIHPLISISSTTTLS